MEPCAANGHDGDVHLHPPVSSPRPSSLPPDRTVIGVIRGIFKG